MQAATEPFLQEFLRDILQHQQQQQQQLGKTVEVERGRAQSRGQKNRDKVVEVELGPEVEAKIAKACQQYEQCLQELASVERHLIQAKASALVQEEKRLANRKQSLCGYDKLINLPSSGESPIRTLLDQELLEKNCLLHPAHYLPEPPSLPHPQIVQPPQEGTPTYLRSTFTFNQHASSLQPIVTSTINTTKTQKVPWRDQPSLGEKETERKALARLRQRGDYLICPRHSSELLSNTSSSGAIKRRGWKGAGKTTQEVQSESPARNVPLFVAEPNQVVFTDYQVGQVYQVNVDIRNISSCSRQVRIVPIKSPYFTVKRGVSNLPEGLIAPGMYITCTITFTPTSLCNYQEEIKVQSHGGYCFSIPVLAARPAPCLSLPEVIDCGSCLAGSSREVELKVENSGGEGTFSFRHPDNQQQVGDVLALGPFSLSPTKFRLPLNHSVSVKVTFRPAEEGKYGENFAVDCDNGETVSIGLTGSADVVSVGCVSIGNTSQQEIQQLMSYDNENQHGERVDPLMIAVDYELYTEKLDECSVVFDAVNPRASSYKTVVIRNYSNVDLPFSWKLFRPLTELHPSNGEDPVVDNPIKSDDSPFSVIPSSGTLPAASSLPFLCQFLPHTMGNFLDTAHLILSNVPSASLDLSQDGDTWSRVPGQKENGDEEEEECVSAVSCVCLYLSAESQVYELEIEPPALLIPAPIPLATDLRRRLKLLSHSISTLHYSWREEEGVTFTPASGSIVSGGAGYCEVVIRRSKEGKFSLNLSCDIQPSQHPVTLPLCGWTLGPQVSVDCSSLQFGLIALGTSSQLTFTLTSHTNTTISLLLRQITHRESSSEANTYNSITDHECLHFTPSSLTLAPHSVATVSVECRPLLTGRLRSIVQCLVEGKVIRCVAVHGEVQCPAVVLGQCRLHEDTAYVGVGVERQVDLINTSLIPTHFHWNSKVEGVGETRCDVSVSPLSGRIGPQETLPVTITAKWDTIGSQPEVKLLCNVDGMREPLLLVLSADVHGLHVNYSIQEKCSAENDNLLCLDFGRNNSLSVPHTLHLLVTNTTAIPARFTTTVRRFPPSPTPPPPPPQPPHTTTTTTTSGKRKSLLSRTVNIGDPNSKTSQQAQKDYVYGLLREGKGCCFLVDPPSSLLHPFTTHTVSVTAYADMWGEYRDTLVCQVEGLEAVEVPVCCHIGGFPLVFQSTAQSQQSLIRFGSHLSGGPPVQRVIRINNTGPQEIRVDWQVFKTSSEDSSQLVDLIIAIGSQFPKQKNSSPSLLPNGSSRSLPPPSQPEDLALLAHSLSQDGTESTLSDELNEQGQRDNEVAADLQTDLELDKPIVRVFLRRHEGVQASVPFTVHPTQMVVPARGQSSFTVTYKPSSSCSEHQEIQHLSGYCLGYLSLDSQMGEGVECGTGYEVSPLRVNLEAIVEQPQLHLESDTDHGLHFSHPASILLHRDQVLDSVSKTHHLTLVNTTSSNLSFSLSCSSSSHFSISPSSSSASVTGDSTTTTLTPHSAISIAVMFRIHLEELRDFTENQKCFSGKLIVQFTNGATQEFPLSGEVTVPHLSVSTEELVLGPCLVGHSLSYSLTLFNTTPVLLPWSIEPDSGLCNVVSVTPAVGVLPAHLGRSDTPAQQHVLLTFTPQIESEYCGELFVRERLTGRIVPIEMTASATSDEIHTTYN